MSLVIVALRVVSGGRREQLRGGRVEGRSRGTQGQRGTARQSADSILSHEQVFLGWFSTLLFLFFLLYTPKRFSLLFGRQAGMIY